MLYKSNEGAGMTNDAAATPIETRQSERRVILASSLGTVFEWYDFYLYGLLATIISAQFFSGVNETTGRSEEHTSELQSLMRISYAVFCLKKKTRTARTQNDIGCSLKIRREPYATHC